jgi:hypothetical protein
LLSSLGALAEVVDEMLMGLGLRERSIEVEVVFGKTFAVVGRDT